MKLPIGIPAIASYSKLLKTDLFGKIESYSNSFIQNNKLVLTRYSRKWTTDPLHQWSRQWEYPFVYSQIQHTKERKNILDAGSGITFLPYLIAKTYAHTNVTCCDSDSTLKSMYNAIDAEGNVRVKFVEASIDHMQFADNYFDIIYCISVIEHTKNIPAIIREFRRILKPKGKLILTFDVSLDGTSEIPIEEAEELLDDIHQTFQRVKIDRAAFKSSNLNRSVTTDYIAKYNRQLLPWRYPILNIIRELMHFRLRLSLYPKLTFCCIMATK